MYNNCQTREFENIAQKLNMTFVTSTKQQDIVKAC